MLIAALLVGNQAGGDDAVLIAYLLAGGVALGGVVQLLWLWYWTEKSGFKLRFRRPRLTKDVKELGIIIIPATFGAGVYQISQFVQLFFATQLPSGSVSHLNFADRLNQLPLGVIGIALGTAILPALSRHIGTDDKAQADRVQSSAIELAMLLTFPAAAALMICAPAFVNAFFWAVSSMQMMRGSRAMSSPPWLRGSRPMFWSRCLRRPFSRARIRERLFTPPRSYCCSSSRSTR